MNASLPPCSVCGNRPAAVLRELSGLMVCKRCFIKEIEGKVRKTMARNRMLDVNDKLAVALSGGKDSVALMHLLFANHGPLLAEQARRGHAAVAITIDEGIAGYREESVAIAKDLCNQFGMQHVIFSFKKAFGASLDELIALASSDRFLTFINEKKFGGQMKNAHLLLAKPCSICGVLRRRLLNDIALALSATRLATGHVLNDEMETFML
nr:ATP-binding protein [Candidatus Sigynarchaeota archaeon]